MNTEKLEKLKKSLDNKFIPDNMKDKIRAEIKKLEADIKTDETITATEVKEEVKEIEKKVEKALEVAEEKEEQAEAKAEEKKEKAPRKAREKKATQSETKTPKVEPKSTAKKKSVFSIAKEIRKDNESWEDAKERARKMMKSETTETKKKTKTETQKLLAMVRRNKEYKKLTGSSDLPKDAQRRALPRGKRVSQGGWKNQYGESEGGKVYYENRANRVDVGGFKNAYLENGGYANKGVYVETLDEEIDLTDDGKPRVIKTQQGGDKSFGERREMHGASPEALAFDNGGSIEDEKFKKFINSQVSYIISLKTISQKREPIQNLLDNMEDYRSGSEIVKRITTDNLKYALQQKTVSKMNEVLRISLNALQYANGGRTRERRYVNHSQDYEVRYSKDKPHRRGYGYAEGGTIIGTPETPLARGLDIDYTGLVGETGGMSAGEMFAEGGSIGQMVNFEDWQLYDRDTDLERMKKSCNAIRKNGFKAIVVEDKGMYYVLYKSMSDLNGKRVYAEGGSIENQYEGKTPKEVWSMWTLKQREHFLLDHFNHFIVSEFKGKSLIEISKLEYNNLPTRVRLELDYHVNKGQYAMGGSLGNHGLKQGDQIIKTMSGGVQKVKTKSGDIVYVNLANGYRGDTPPLPFAKGGYTNERRHVNKAQDYEVRYAKDKPNRTGYFGKRSFDDGGEISSKQLDLGYQYSFEKDEDNVGSLYKEAGVYSVIGFENGKHFSESFEKFTDAKKFYLDKKGKVKFDDGGYMTDPNFGDFQSGVYATGGVTKNYINRNQLNTITIKKGDKKLTYKVSDVYNGAYKLEDGGNLERTAFYVSKRNVVKVQLKDGKDVKVANGYWIKKGAKPIHTSKYDDGGQLEMEYAGGGETKMVDGVMYEKVKFSNGVEDYYYSSDLHKVNFYCNEHGLNPKNQKDFEKAFSELKKQNKISYKGGGKTTFKEKATAIAKKFEGKKVEPKYQKEYGKTYDKAEAKEVGNKIAGSQKAKYDSKMSGGGSTKRGGAMQLAKQIRKEGESWQSALKRANEQMRKK